MGYRVEYRPIGKQRRREKQVCRLPALTASFLLLFVLLVFSFWPKGAEILKEIVIPGEPRVTVAAMEAFSVQLREGEAVSDAFAAFCQTILAGEQLDSD